jgi:hypothetical protein
VTVRRFAPFLCTGFVILVAACGAATDPTLIDVPGYNEAGAGGTVSAESGGESSGSDATVRATDAPYDSTGPASHSDSGDGMGGGAGTSAEGAACTPVTVMGVPSSGGGACTAGTVGAACYPHDETEFSPKWVPPLPLGSRCTATQIDDFYNLCLGPMASDTPCGTWTGDSANATCLGCLKTPSTASAYGVFIQFPGNVVELNEAGCVALAEPCNLRCAQTWLASIECREAACTSTNCPAQGDQITCAMNAAACSACEGYAEAASCMTELTGPDHPAGALCAIGSEDDVTMADYTSVATFMCGM